MAAHDLRAPKPQRPAKFSPDILSSSSHAPPPAYSFPSLSNVQPAQQRGHSRNEERKRTTSLLSTRSNSARPLPPAQSSAVDSNWLAGAARSARSRSRASRRPASPANSDFSVASTSHLNPSTNRSITAVLQEGNALPKRAKYDSFARRWVRWMHKTGKRRWTMPALVFTALLVKSAVGLGPHSGMGKAPLFGDYEAQRHWLSLTWHLPVSQWYFHNLDYWGLDYPPLTAYHSYALAWIASKIGRGDIVDLQSAGKLVVPESATKVFMRTSVLLSELVLWVPVVVLGWCGVVMSGKGTSRPKRSERSKAVAAATVLLQPALILIDNGHFQYNSVMLGFSLLAVVSFHLDRDLVGAATFVCALCFKQMALYFAPAIFAYLLGKCFYMRGHGGMSHLINIAFVSTATLLALFSPFLLPPSQLQQALHRIFPFARGLFEDKVANFWCAINVVVKLRSIADVTILARLSLVVTFFAILPSMLGLLYVSWAAGKRQPGQKPAKVPPTVTLLPYALFNSAMAFFLFSFQVHEKSILLPLLPATLLMATSEPGMPGEDWEWGVLLNNVGIFSMWPLLKRDGLGTSYLALTFLWNHLIGNDVFALETSFVKGLSLIVYAGIAILHLLEAVASPPSHLPDLFAVLNLTLSASIFALSLLWGFKRQIEESWALIGMTDLEPSPLISTSRVPSRVSSPAPSTTNFSRAKSPIPRASSALGMVARPPSRQVVSSAGDGFGGVVDSVPIQQQQQRRRHPSGDSRRSGLFEPPMAMLGDATRSYARSEQERPKSRAQRLREER